ncbi:MAG: hypothetical protein AAF611_11215 [Bacteroidota bacterium]
MYSIVFTQKFIHDKKKLKLFKSKVASLNEISNLLGGTDGGGDPDPTTKGNPKSKDDVKCASRRKVLTICVDTNVPQTDPTDP